MKHVKILSALSLLAVAGAANAEVEVSGSMGIASTYLWRGIDLGSGTPAVSGDLHASAMGFYGGVWGSSGDTVSGTEYDLYAGYGGSVDKFTYDISYWTYVYPTGAVAEDLGTPGKLSEGIVSLGYGPVSVFYNKNIATPGDGDGDYSYYGIKGKLGAFTAVLAQHNPGVSGSDKMTHLDLSYAYNDNLSFTISKQISDKGGNAPYFVTDANGKPVDKLKLVASYSVPFGK
ncbi:MAG: TorF family putative porin [Steroidobacteraceae bacterium]